MTQSSGVTLFASGDYALDERQRYLFNTIERLQAHMVSLRDKLHEEKLLLSELKAETQYLSMQQNMSPEEYHNPSYPSESNISYSGLNSYSTGIVYTDENDIINQEDGVRNRQVEGTTVNLGPTMNLGPIVNLDRFEYVQKLKEIDNLCKVEMARVNSVAEKIEPLNQIASDWTLETRLNELCVEPIFGRQNAVVEGETAQQHVNQTGTKPISYGTTTLDRVDYTNDLIVMPSGQERRLSTLKPVFIAGGDYDSYVDSKTGYDQSIESELQEVSEWKMQCSQTDLQLDSALKKLSDLMNNPNSKLEDITNLEQEQDKPKVTSKSSISETVSEVSLTSKDDLKMDNNFDSTKTATCSISVEEPSAQIQLKEAASGEEVRSTTSESKSAISLESIQRAFATYKGRYKNTRSDSGINLSGTKKKNKKETNNAFKKENNNRNEDSKLMKVLHPSIKKLVRNWGGLEKPEKKKKSVFQVSNEKELPSENDEGKMSLCEDDVINKFLYDEEGYVYTPLFVSENEGDYSSGDN